MKYKIEVLKKDVIRRVGDLASDVKLNEPVDYDCTFLGARNNGTLLGVIGVNFKRPLYPQFEHIIIREEAQKTRIPVHLLNRMERWLEDKGYDTYVSYIKNTRNHMQMYAKKWGMRSYDNNSDGVWFYKLINTKKGERNVWR